MRHIAYYAPLKPLDHPTPSGDRTIARGIFAALQDLTPTPQVTIPSTLRSRDGRGDNPEIIHNAQREVDRILSEKPDFTAWVTYHNYYKAPDLIGPAVTRCLNIPYLIIEASRSPKRLTGPWAKFATAAESACDHANTILYLTDRDRPALELAKPDHQRLSRLAPFLDQKELPQAARPKGANRIVTIGMLRAGDKEASYQNLAAAVSVLQTKDLSLIHI